MGWKNILLFGSVNGVLMAILMILNVISGVTDDVDFVLAMLSLLVVILIPPFILTIDFSTHYCIDIILDP